MIVSGANSEMGKHGNSLLAPSTIRFHHKRDARPSPFIAGTIIRQMLVPFPGSCSLQEYCVNFKRRDKDQLGTRTSAGRMRSLQLTLQPFSTSGARPAIWKKCMCARQSRRRLCRAMTNPPCYKFVNGGPLHPGQRNRKGIHVDPAENLKATPTKT